ncbi:MAG TPA: energy-coupling factor transporter transmembrane component T [Bacillota bacterium]|nr:energy-coupling factor transporter transmembrane component T [Bacillota bacterium]
MAELNIYHYLPGKSFIHHMDPRFKFICMILLSIATSITNRISDLVALSLLLVIVLFCSKLPLRKLLLELRYFIFLILLVLLVHSFSIPGIPLTHLPWMNPTREGLISGLLFAWRIVLLVAISVIVTATTTLSTLKDAIRWFLYPVPLIPEAKVATMIGLTFILVPLIFDQASEISDAQKARCIAGRKNPVPRIIFLVFPLMLQTFRRADEMVDAMESRCYSETRTPVTFRSKTGDWMVLILSGLLCGMVLGRIPLGF